MEIILDYLSGWNVITGILTRKIGGSESEIGRCEDVGFEDGDGATRSGMTIGSLLKLGRQRNRSFPRAKRRNTVPWHLYFRTSTSNKLRINLCCYKPLCLWQIVTAVTIFLGELIQVSLKNLLITDTVIFLYFFTFSAQISDVVFSLPS